MVLEKIAHLVSEGKKIPYPLSITLCVCVYVPIKLHEKIEGKAPKNTKSV